jgi:hypothetical protein
MHIDTTVRAAYDHDFKSISFRDACATKDLKLMGKVTNEVQIAYLAG